MGLTVKDREVHDTRAVIVEALKEFVCFLNI